MKVIFYLLRNSGNSKMKKWIAYLGFDVYCMQKLNLKKVSSDLVQRVVQ
jgi:hypothetical protein